jgi:hypothetical protein
VSTIINALAYSHRQIRASAAVGFERCSVQITASAPHSWHLGGHDAGHIG